MPTPQHDHDDEFLQRMGRIEALIEELERLADPAAQATAQGLVQAVMDLHAVGFDKLVRLLRARGHSNGPAILNSLASDDLLGSLLLLHDAHPWDAEQRVAFAVEQVGKALAETGGWIELVEVDEHHAHVRIDPGGGANGRGCRSSSASLTEAVEQAIRDKAPELETIKVENIGESAGSAGLVTLTIDPHHHHHHSLTQGARHG